MKFEILLDNDPKLRDSARRQIEAIAGSTSENFIPEEDYPAFGHLVEVNAAAAVAGPDVWQLHNRLLEVDGVVDVDLELELPEKETEINARYFAESALYSSAEAVHPPADWYHHAIKFPEAVQCPELPYSGAQQL